MKNKLSRKHQTLLNDAPKQIIRLEADINYTVFYMQSGKTQVMSYSLKNYQDSLTFPFVRVNKSCIINLHFFSEIDTSSKKILLKDGSEFVISRRRLEEVCRNISNY